MLYPKPCSNELCYNEVVVYLVNIMKKQNNKKCEELGTSKIHFLTQAEIIDITVICQHYKIKVVWR